ncbi:MAG: extracellular solute-binding protein, partial [Actinomyces sp.]|nr:extracellular solute-binding protein [Actinomyces sp.]
AFEADRLVYYRNWPYQYSLTKEKLGDKFGVAPLPGFTADQPEGGVSSLGGHNVAISSFCKNKATAYDFIKWFTSEEIGKRMLTEQTLAPIYTALYEDPELIDQYPYLPALKGSIESAAPRPQVVNYGDVSAAIQDAVFPVLQRQATPEQALKDLSAKLTELTAGQQ